MTSIRDRQEEKELIRSRVRLDELVRELAGSDLRRRGADDLWACCPFHAEDTPSFHVRPARGLYKCFGCGEAGDVFSFVQKIRGIGFREALEFLADRVGVTLGELTPEQRRKAQENRRLRQVLEAAGSLFKDMLKDGRDNPARRYMRERGFDDATLERFDVGLVPDDLPNRLRRGGFKDAEIRAAGFTRQFGGRLSFGIRDGMGTLVGFGARRLAEDDGPKYVNTRETQAFNKGQILYGLDKASRAVMRTRRLLVMEGYTDVMMAHQRGLEESVAAMGTSLTRRHVEMLASRARNVVFVFDGDEAGVGAAERAVRLALTEGLESRVLSLPEESDPCDWLCSRERDAFETLLEERGLSTVTFLARTLLGRLDPGQPGGREQVARELLELSRTLADPVRRESVAAEIARECALDRNTMRRSVGASATQATTGSGESDSRRPVSAAVRSQFVAIGGLATVAGSRDELERLDDEGILSHPAARRLLEIGRTLSGDPVDPLEWLDTVREHEPRLAASLERILFPPPDAILPRYEEAVAHLRASQRDEAARAARRSALSRPDIHTDGEALAALDASLRARRRPSASEPSNTEAGAGTGASTTT